MFVKFIITITFTTSFNYPSSCQISRDDARKNRQEELIKELLTAYPRLSRDECVFYLEASEGDLDRAVAMIC